MHSLATSRGTRVRVLDDEGASAVEYGLLVAAIAAIIILVVFALGTFVKGAFQDTCQGFKNSNSVNSFSGATNDCSQ
jgi:pilus assembly protein Flp/PilA